MVTDTLIESLIVYHREKNGNAILKGNPCSLVDKNNYFFLDTCQRQIWMTTTKSLPKLKQGSQQRWSSEDQSEDAIESFNSTQAYEFLLYVTTGLASAIPGETEIFSQFKRAWNRNESSGSLLAKELNPLIQRLYEDTKKIRSEHLRGHGGVSYGSLARSILNPELNDRILIVGAGKLAHSVAPYLSQYELWLWNRSECKLAALHSRVAQSSSSFRCKLIHTHEEERRAWVHATHAIICTPPTPEKDLNWIQFWMQGLKNPGIKKGTVLHLGDLESQNHPWNQISNFKSLRDLFDLQKDHRQKRQAIFTEARLACKARALLRLNPPQSPFLRKQCSTPSELGVLHPPSLNRNTSHFEEFVAG